MGGLARWRWRCSSMGWYTLIWRAALRAWAPFIVDVVEAARCAAIVYWTPTVTPLGGHSLCVRLVWSEASAAAAVEPGSTSKHGQTLRFAALHRPASRATICRIGNSGRRARCMDSVGLVVHRGSYGGYLVLFWPPLRPEEHEFFVSGGDRALRVDAPSIGGGYDTRYGPR